MNKPEVISLDRDSRFDLDCETYRQALDELKFINQKIAMLRIILSDFESERELIESYIENLENENDEPEN